MVRELRPPASRARWRPGTGTPEVEGFTTHEGLSLLRAVCREAQTVGMDLVEVLPDKDPSGITALAGASMIHAFLAALAGKKAASHSAA